MVFFVNFGICIVSYSLGRGCCGGGGVGRVSYNWRLIDIILVGFFGFRVGGDGVWERGF